jgi:rod shape determining protein RodA
VIHTRRFDWTLAVAVVAIAVLGMLNLYSATWTSRPQLYSQQLSWMAIGLVGFAAAAALDYRHLERLAYPLYALGVASLVLVLIVGRTANGSRRWLEAGGQSVQPSEFMKLFLILALARFLHSWPVAEGRALRHLLIPFAMVALPVALVLRQPDLGTSLILVLIFATIVLLTRLRPGAVLSLALVAGLAAPLTWTHLLKDYQRQRIMTFVQPASDPAGSGWHARQALTAVGAGQLGGRGFLHGTQTQLHFLPERWTDFPFAVWAEEWGFVGSAALLGLYLFLILWAVRLASEARERFGAILCAGVAALLFWHAFINIGMVTGVLPVVGVTLPLLSYGGSSVLTVLVGLGLLMSVSLRRYQV